MVDHYTLDYYCLRFTARALELTCLLFLSIKELDNKYQFLKDLEYTAHKGK